MRPLLALLVVMVLCGCESDPQYMEIIIGPKGEPVECWKETAFFKRDGEWIRNSLCLELREVTDKRLLE